MQLLALRIVQVVQLVNILKMGIRTASLAPWGKQTHKQRKHLVPLAELATTLHKQECNNAYNVAQEHLAVVLELRAAQAVILVAIVEQQD